ncbi:MAG: hypothetical protein V1904_12085 [Bacteroidota bacterium]
MFFLIPFAFYCCNSNNACNIIVNYPRQTLYDIDKWHVKIDISDKYTLNTKYSFAIIKDTVNNKNAYIYLLDKSAYEEYNFKSNVTAHAKGISSAASHGRYYEGDTITKWEKNKNSKGTEINKVYVEYALHESNNTSDEPGYVPPAEIYWKITKRDTLGPFFYIEMPEKYGKELGMACAFNINGDSAITKDIVDDFEIK